MSDLKLDEFGDLDITSGRLALIQTEEQLLSQKLEILFKTFQGEWFLDTRFGIPYTQVILKKGTPKELVDSIIFKAITGYTEVTNIVEFNSTISKGVYSLLFKAKITGGEIVTIQQNISTI
jgi:hypothetical protein